MVRIGISESKTISVSTATSEVADKINWYNVELTNIDGRVVAKCLDVQGAVSDGKDEDEAIDNIIEAIRGILNG